MKKLCLTFLAVVLVSVSVIGQSLNVSTMQEQDLKEFGYPILYQEPSLNRDTGVIYVSFKNISSEVINKTVFTYSTQGRENNLTNNDSIQPNESKRSGWLFGQGLSGGTITRIEVTFINGKTSNFEASQTSVMLVNEYYSLSNKERLVSLSANSRLEDASNLQIQDLVQFGYPILFEEPSINPNTGFVTINYKNITSEVISKVIFTLRLTGGRIENLPVTDSIQPNESKRSRWTPWGSMTSGAITGVEVTFIDGKTANFNASQALFMLANKNYSGQIAQAESQRIAQEQATRERAERQRLEQEQIARERAERQRIEQEAASERQRIAQEEAARRQRAEQEEVARRQEETAQRQRLAQEQAAREMAAVEAAYREALATRSPDIIMQFIRDNRRRDGFNADAYLEVARLLTRNNNILLEWLGDALNRAGPGVYDRLSTIAEVTRVFDQSKVYFAEQLIVDQRIDGGIIVTTGYNDARQFILLRNVSRVESYGGNNWVLQAFMRYTGVTTLRLVNGGTREVATFNVLYHYRP